MRFFSGSTLLLCLLEAATLLPPDIPKSDGVVARRTEPAPTPTPQEVSITPGAPVTAAVGKRCIVEITTTAKKVTWRLPPG